MSVSSTNSTLSKYHCRYNKCIFICHQIIVISTLVTVSLSYPHNLSLYHCHLHTTCQSTTVMYTQNVSIHPSPQNHPCIHTFTSSTKSVSITIIPRLTSSALACPTSCICSMQL
ncbi:hypothetical protein NP493_1277g00021 [Ridgeia piscesae]|uniref:Uncharacterized protein n=1 Tax=Ridgeia piscesae TaxID=27915 RepID=A0AAD9KA24_RIDPI|nr:hypothetical protein NP493_1277g00021 [Ridgeia piscesae]